MSAFAPGNTPLIVLRTGAAGYAEFALVTLYVAALAVYYVGPYLYADASSYSTVFNVFYVWAAFKPVLPVMAAIYTALQMYVLGPIIAYLVVAGVLAVGSLGLFITLLAEFGRCNTVTYPSAPCNDPLYCCAYWDSVPACAGFGPCNGTTVDTPGELAVAENHLWLTWFTLSLFVLEVLLAVLAYLVYQRRFIKKRQADVLIEEALRDKYGQGAIPAGGLEAVATPEAEAGEENFSVNARIGGKLDMPLSDGMRMRQYREQHQLPYWQARAHATFDAVDDWLDWGRFHLEQHVHESVGAALLRHELSDAMAAQWSQQQQQQQQQPGPGGYRPVSQPQQQQQQRQHPQQAPVYGTSLQSMMPSSAMHLQQQQQPPSAPLAPSGAMLDTMRHAQFEAEQREAARRQAEFDRLHQRAMQEDGVVGRRDWVSARNQRDTIVGDRHRRR